MDPKARKSIFHRLVLWLKVHRGTAVHEDPTRGWPVLPVRLRDLSAIPPQPPHPVKEKRKRD